MDRSVLIAGASRGIGYELAQAYREDQVYGFAREAPQDMSRFAAFRRSDARDFAAGLFPELADRALHRLYLCCAVFGPQPADAMALAPRQLEELFAVNCSAQLGVLQACLPALERAGSAKVAMLISRGGLQRQIKGAGAIGYRVTKAAQIALALSLVEPLRARGVSLFLINPGWVQTRLGGRNAPVRPADSATGVARVVEALDAAASGSLHSWDGSALSL